MKVSDLISILKKLPSNSEIEFYHQIYCGDGDEDTFDEPMIFIDDEGCSYLSVRRLKESLEYAIESKTVLMAKGENRMTVNNEKTELEEYINKLVGGAWKALAKAQYEKSRSEGRTHKEAFVDTLDKIIEVSSKILFERKNKACAKGIETKITAGVKT